ncbi:MAG: amidohydrolase family protein [Clostridiales bacterium]|uniref:metal-dependent hydrolase family protein n=1 Tax=Provencibacterium massiliense TaxID=1841868 RepID=UPI0009A5839E|nr:amidohydrolase family protein [Provencibacterium massiliense]PWM39481.1 MAG: amidohydrolase family protein [Clostridiales bacterium]RGB66274.1 amidohydrolase family protein [Harryflintia acetispora]
MLILKGRVIDGRGGEPIERGIVAVDGNRIAAVCNEWEYPVPENAEVIEVGDGTILPGFIDTHVHMGVGDDYYRIYQRHAYHGVCECIRDMKQILDAGFTSIREVGGISNYLKAPWEEGLIAGPRICSAGKSIAQSGGHWDFIKDYPIEFTMHPDRNITSEICDGVDNVRRTVRMHFREKCDVIKVMGGPGISCQGNKLFTREFSDEELRAFAAEADNYGSYVCIHAHAPVAINAALHNGIKCIEHGTLIDEEGIELMLKKDAWLVPTLATSYLSWQHIDERAPWVKEKMTKIKAMKGENLKRAHKAGVTIACGCDFGGGTITVHGNNGLEFPLLVEEAGMTPMEAIVAGTRTSSRLLMREDELGTLERGKLADVVVCKGNPLEDIALLGKAQNIKVVIQDGKIKKQIS